MFYSQIVAMSGSIYINGIVICSIIITLLTILLITLYVRGVWRGVPGVTVSLKSGPAEDGFFS